MGELFQPVHLILLLLIVIPLIAVHFLPAIIAGVRRAQNFWWILAVNFFLGWTVLGWIAALIWSIRDMPEYYVAPIPPAPYNS